MASFAVAGVFTHARIIFFISSYIKELISIRIEYLKVLLACYVPTVTTAYLRLVLLGRNGFSSLQEGDC